MASNHETQSTAGRKNAFLETWKKFNKVSVAVLATAGVVLQSPALLLLASVDVAQNYTINRFEKWRGKAKTVGKVALAAT